MNLETANRNMAANSGAELPQEPAKCPVSDRYITIPLAEYIYLNRIDSMVDVLLADDSYNSCDAVGAVKAAIQELRHAINTAEAVAVE